MAQGDRPEAVFFERRPRMTVAALAALLQRYCATTGSLGGRSGKKAS
jgi:hypothetical protein